MKAFVCAWIPICISVLCLSEPAEAAKQLNFTFRLGFSSYAVEMTSEAIELRKEPGLEAFRVPHRPCYSAEFDLLQEVISKRVRLRHPAQVLSQRAMEGGKSLDNNRLAEDLGTGNAYLFEMAGRQEIIRPRTSFGSFLAQLPRMIESAELQMGVQCRPPK